MAITFLANNTIWQDPDLTCHVQDVGPTGAHLLIGFHQEVTFSRATAYMNPVVPTTEFNGIADVGAFCIAPPAVDAVWIYVNIGTKAANVWQHIGTLQ